jgi:hypothetical protein
MHRVQVPLVSEAEMAGISRWESAGQVPRLPLSEAVSWPVPVGVDTRGGWNRKPLDMDEVVRMVEEGATAAQISHEFNINYERARRLVVQFSEEDEYA